MGTFLAPGSKPFPKAGHCDTGDLLRNKHNEGVTHSWGSDLFFFLLQSYSPTVFERYNVTLQMQGKPVHLQIWDTAGKWGALGGRKEKGSPSGQALALGGAPGT